MTKDFDENRVGSLPNETDFQAASTKNFDKGHVTGYLFINFDTNIQTTSLKNLDRNRVTSLSNDTNTQNESTKNFDASPVNAPLTDTNIQTASTLNYDGSKFTSLSNYTRTRQGEATELACRKTEMNIIFELRIIFFSIFWGLNAF